MEDERRYSKRYGSSVYRRENGYEREYVNSRYTGNSGRKRESSPQIDWQVGQRKRAYTHTDIPRTQQRNSERSRERRYPAYTGDTDRTPQQSEEYIRRRKIQRWKVRRKRILRRRIFFSALLLIIILFVIFLLSFLKNIGNDDKETKTADVTAKGLEIEEEPEVVDEPFVNILEKEGGDLTISSDGPVEKEMYDNMLSDIQASIDRLTAEGYTTGFVLYDLNSGGGISYRPDEIYYSASAIKGPYVIWVVQEYPSAASDMYSTLSDTISWSSNSDYFTLINTYGKSGFNAWTAELGVPNVAMTDGSYGPISARDFTKVWCYMYDYFISGQDNADTIRDLYIGTEESSISETLGEKYTVYSKAGWIADANDPYYNVQNDAGVVMKEGHPYVLVLLSNAYGRHDLLDNLTDCLDRAHSGLMGLGYERPVQNTADAAGEEGDSEQTDGANAGNTESTDSEESSDADSSSDKEEETDTTN